MSYLKNPYREFTPAWQEAAADACRALGVSLIRIREKDNTRFISDRRAAIAIYLKGHYDTSLQDIAKYMRRSNHSTIFNYVRKMIAYPEVLRFVDIIEENHKNNVRRGWETSSLLDTGDKLKGVELRQTKTGLVFVAKKSKDTRSGLFAQYWTADQLRTVADFLDNIS